MIIEGLWDDIGDMAGRVIYIYSYIYSLWYNI